MWVLPLTWSSLEEEEENSYEAGEELHGRRSQLQGTGPQHQKCGAGQEGALLFYRAVGTELAVQGPWQW